MLEGKNDYKEAPIETIFLPYYISQSVGWVYLRKSFGNLDFFRNFKEDYLDYYLGIENFYDRAEKLKLTNELSNIQREMSFFNKIEDKNPSLQISKMMDEHFQQKSIEYIENYKNKKAELAEQEKEYVAKCNELTYFNERKNVLYKVSKNHKTQSPETGHCPTCTQSLPITLAKTYKYHQESNDTSRELELYKDKITTAQSKVNSIFKKINEAKEEIHKNYEVLKEYSSQGVTYENWLKNKANLKLVDNVTLKTRQLAKDELETKNKLKKFKTEKDIQEARTSKIRTFKTILEYNFKDLHIKALEDGRYTDLYRITAFPSDGVELHKSVMAYHFAFNRIIQQTGNVHRAPFLLDAIFKEDIDNVNKERVVSFISKNKPTDTQVILSVAVTEKDVKNVVGYNNKYFNNSATFIVIGDAIRERSLLSEHTDQMKDHIEETLSICNSL